MRISLPLAQLVTISALVALVSACSSAPEPEHDENVVSSGEQALTSNEKSAYEFFANKGLSKVQATGIVGNLIQESNVLPGSAQPGGPGRGIAQWSIGGRWNADHHDNVTWYASTHGASTGSLNLQLEFIWYELESFSGYGLSNLRAAKNIADATIIFQEDFEGCGQCPNETGYCPQVGNGQGGRGTGSSCQSPFRQTIAG